MIFICRIGGQATVLFFGGFVIDKNGRPLIRYRYDGSAFYVKEPGLLKELFLLLIGSATYRDQLGIPITDAYGKNVRYPNAIKKRLIKRFTQNKTRKTAEKVPSKSLNKKQSDTK